MSSRSESKEIPLELYDNKTNTYYKKGRFLGKGGFAKCYEITDGRSGAIFAGKIVPKVSNEVNVYKLVRTRYFSFKILLSQ